MPRLPPLTLLSLVGAGGGLGSAEALPTGRDVAKPAEECGGGGAGVEGKAHSL